MPKPLDLSKSLTRFRGTIARGLAERESPVDPTGGDKQAGIIYGAAIITRGEALGHGHWCDATFCASVADALNAFSAAGLKARFAHPDMSGDGIGTFLGRWKLGVVDGDLVRADLHFSRSAHRSPDGDLAEYVMGLALEDPEAFGTSIVFMHDYAAEDAFRAEHTTEVETTDEWGEKRKRSIFKSPDPDNKKNLRHVRLKALLAADVVDEPAANPGGMFHRSGVAHEAEALVSYALGLSNERPALSRLDVDPDRAMGFVTRLLERNQLELRKKESPMPAEQTTSSAPPTQQSAAPTTQATSPATETTPPTSTPPATPAPQNAEQLAAAQAAGKAAEKERVTQITALCAQANHPDLAQGFIDADKSVADVQKALFSKLCEDRKPVGELGTEGGTSTSDPDAAYKKEFAQNKAHYQKLGVSEESYILSRRIDDGVEVLKPKDPQQAA